MSQINSVAGTQTLQRGLDIIDAVSRAPLSLGALAVELGLTKSTAHRLASSLVERGYLAHGERGGYRLGPRILDLGWRAQCQITLVQVARHEMEALARLTGHTVHLGIRADDRALYLAKIAGSRRVDISSHVGELHPLTRTGLGKALLLDGAASEWRKYFRSEQPAGDPDHFVERMTAYVSTGQTFDLEENEDRIRCVAAPLRDARAAIVGAISVSGAAQYMDDARMAALADEVRSAADAIGNGLGWTPDRED